MGARVLQCDTINHPANTVNHQIELYSDRVEVNDIKVARGYIAGVTVGRYGVGGVMPDGTNAAVEGYFSTVDCNFIKFGGGNIGNTNAGAIVNDDLSVVMSLASQTGSDTTLTGPVTVGTNLTVNGNTVLGDASTDTVTLTATMSGNGVNYTGMPGEIRMWAGSTAPTGWLFCDGQAINSVTYATLHAVITNNYGGSAYVQGVTDTGGGVNFNVPNFKGRVPMGEGTGVDGSNSASGNTPTGNPLTARNLGAHGGAESQTLAQFENDINASGYTWYAKSSASLDTVPPMMVVNFIIKT